MRSKRELARWLDQELEKREPSLKLDKVPEDPLSFFKDFLRFKATSYQREFIRGVLASQFSSARWCRQAGKSYIISSFLLWYSLVAPRHIGIVAPSFRQSKLVIRKISGFAALPRVRPYVSNVLRTRIYCRNGSVIEAFPNNPDTIRGPTLDLVYIDEFNFCAEDDSLYEAILFTLSTTEGKFITTSTPWTQDSIFYKIWNDPDYSDYYRSHITWRDALEPKGPLKRGILNKIKKQFAADPFRWMREMEAEWAEDEDVYFSQTLITRCQNDVLEYWKERDLIANLPSTIRPHLRVGPSFLPQLLPRSRLR